MRKVAIIALAALFVCGSAFAGDEGLYKVYAQDACPVLRIMNTGTNTIQYANTTAASTVTVNGAATAITYSGMSADEAGVLVGAILAVNADIKCELMGALSADAVDGLVIATSTFTLERGKWYEVTFWDTSGVVRYDTVYAGGDDYNAPIWLDGIYGLPGGTGALTVYVYAEGTLVWTTSTPTTWPTGQTTNVVALDEVLRDWGGLHIGMKKVHVRAARATTATTGSLGMVVRQGY